MKTTKLLACGCVLACTPVFAAEPHSEPFTALKAEIQKALPKVDGSQEAALLKAREAVKAAESKAKEAQQSIDRIRQAKGLVDHAKGKWIGGAEKGIAAAEAALRKATTEAEREAANKDLAKWRADKEAGLKALKERQEALNQAKASEPAAAKANEAAQAALVRAQADERAAAMVLLASIDPLLSNDRLDDKLAKCLVLAGLSNERGAMVEKLLADSALMKQMLEAGGAKFGEYGRAMEIYSAIQNASPRSREGTLQRLALATSLEHARPIARSNPKDQTSAPKSIDPVKRYQHYEKAFLDGELDPAFKNLSAWELRMVVNCDAPDEILSWGREMLRNYRPDHIHNPDYGWRYSAAVKTEVPYGSQNVKNDLPSLQFYQNIIKDGGVCGRRAFFGRFILRSFGIPVWGVTQHAHAALSHWTPHGWVVNLGAGFEQSWWDKDEAPRSGSDFLLETQARAHGRDYQKVLRARWISRILGEPQYNDRKGIEGGFWSRMARYQTEALASSAVGLAPLGQELAEANEPKATQASGNSKPTEADQRITIGPDGGITIPAVACGKAKGTFITMKGFSGGMQLHCLGGFKGDYEFEAPNAGNYSLTARVVTVQEGQTFIISANDAKEPVEIAVPYTVGEWRQTLPVTLALAAGKNILHLALKDGSRGVSIRGLKLKPEP